jgi:hypothetical protein
MAASGQLARHVMGASAGFHDHGAGGKRSEKLDQLLTADLLAKHGLAVSILAVKMKRMLAQIDSNQHYVLHDGLPQKRTPYRVTRV